MKYPRELIQRFNEERAAYLSFMGITERQVSRSYKQDHMFWTKDWYGNSKRVWVPDRLCTPKQYKKYIDSKINEEKTH